MLEANAAALRRLDESLAPDPIDLAALKLEAESDDGDCTVVSRAWLKRAYEELSAARAAEAALGRVFGRPPL